MGRFFNCPEAMNSFIKAAQDAELAALDAAHAADPKLTAAALQRGLVGGMANCIADRVLQLTDALETRSASSDALIEDLEARIAELEQRLGGGAQ